MIILKIIYLLIEGLISSIDRKYNLTFKKNLCVSIKLSEEVFRYNDLIIMWGNTYRCLGKSWYKLQNEGT